MFVAGDGNADLNPYSPYGSFSSALYPANTWEDYMEAATAGMDYKSFPALNNIGASSGNNATYAPTSSQSSYPTSNQSYSYPTSNQSYSYPTFYPTEEPAATQEQQGNGGTGEGGGDDDNNAPGGNDPAPGIGGVPSSNHT